MKGMNIITTVLAVVLIAISATTQIRSERSDHRCGPCFGCEPCDLNHCCSAWSYCGGEDAYCNTADNTTTCQPVECIFDDVNNTVHGWDDLKAARVTCSSYSANISVAGGMEEGGGRHRNPFCMNGQQRESNETDIDDRASCGQCLKVTKRETGAETMVRLPTSEECSSDKHSDFETRIFKEFDTNGEGAAQGYLTVNYQVVQCDDQH